MMDSIKQDLKEVEEEEDQYEKDMKLQVGKRVKQCVNSGPILFKPF